jgi:hypothetical protein
LKKVWTIAGAVLLALLVLLSGCSQKSNGKPKDILIEAYGKSAEITSAKFEGSIRLSLDLPDSALQGDPSSAMILNMLSNAELSFRGTTQLEPALSEVILTVRVTGDTEIAINLSIIATEDKIWIKVPNTPFLPLPDHVVGKYLELDVAELSAMSGEPISSLTTEQQQRYQQLGKEIAELFFGAFDEETYFSHASKEEAGIPDDVDADQVVKFELTDESFRPFMESLFAVLPALIDKIAEIQEAGLTQAEIEELKAELQAGEEEWKATLDLLEQNMTIHRASIVTAVDKNGFVSYTGLDIDLEMTDEGETGRIGLQAALEQTGINEKVEYELQKPDASEVITFQELLASIMYGL